MKYEVSFISKLSKNLGVFEADSEDEAIGLAAESDAYQSIGGLVTSALTAWATKTKGSSRRSRYGPPAPPRGRGNGARGRPDAGGGEMSQLCAHGLPGVCIECVKVQVGAIRADNPLLAARMDLTNAQNELSAARAEVEALKGELAEERETIDSYALNNNIVRKWGARWKALAKRLRTDLSDEREGRENWMQEATRLIGIECDRDAALAGAAALRDAVAPAFDEYIGRGDEPVSLEKAFAVFRDSTTGADLLAEHRRYKEALTQIVKDNYPGEHNNRIAYNALNARRGER